MLTSELLWLRWLLIDMGLTHFSTTMLHYDYRNAIHISHNNIFHERIQRIEIIYHFIRHRVIQRTICLIHISSANQTANIFTKSHFSIRFHDFISKLKLSS